jgi:hypothetical protein
MSAVRRLRGGPSGCPPLWAAQVPAAPSTVSVDPRRSGGVNCRVNCRVNPVATGWLPRPLSRPAEPPAATL